MLIWRPHGRTIPAYALYIDPPLDRAGLTEAEVFKTGRSALIGKRPMAKVGRAVEKNETQGFMEIVIDTQTREILKRRHSWLGWGRQVPPTQEPGKTQ